MLRVRSLRIVHVPDPGPSGNSKLFLALGDSYTIGEGVAESERWPAQLAVALRPVAVEVQIVARTGWTAAELAVGLDEAAPHGAYDLVSLQIGVNDQFRRLDLDEFERELSGLLDRASGLAGGDASRVMVVSIPDWGMTPFAAGHDREGVAAEIDAFNNVVRTVAQRRKTPWVDVTSISRQFGADALTGDGLHPSAEQYAAWVEVMMPVAGKVLGRTE